jgi:hypothetical protein
MSPTADYAPVAAVGDGDRASDEWQPWGARLAQLAPGLFRSRLVVLGAICAVPWITPLIYVESVVRLTAGVLLLGHIISSVIVRYARNRDRARWVAAGELAVDGVGCGILVGAGGLEGAGLPVAAVVLVMAFDTGRWRALWAAAALMVVVGVATASRTLGTPLIFRPSFPFPTALRVDPSFANTPTVVGGAVPVVTILDADGAYRGRPVDAPQALSFPTTLRVDASFLGVSALGASNQLFVPAVGLAVLAICVGSGASLVAQSQGPSGAAEAAR